MLNQILVRLCIRPGGSVCVSSSSSSRSSVSGRLGLLPRVPLRYWMWLSLHQLGSSSCQLGVLGGVQVLVSVSVSGPVCLVWPFLSVFLVRSALSEFGRGGGVLSSTSSLSLSCCCLFVLLLRCWSACKYLTFLLT